MLGTERSGNGVLIGRDGLVLTIGYLITEAETIWLGLSDGRTVPGHALGYDQATGFGLVQALARLDLPALAARQFARRLESASAVVVAGAGGAPCASPRAIVAASRNSRAIGNISSTRRSSPRRPTRSGAAAALIGPAGDLLRHRLAPPRAAKRGGKRRASSST